MRNVKFCTYKQMKDKMSQLHKGAFKSEDKTNERIELNI